MSTLRAYDTQYQYHSHFHSILRNIRAGEMPFSPSNSIFSVCLNQSTNLTGNVERPVTTTGRLSKPVTSVTINQQQATLEQGGLAFSFANFFLREGTNMITAVGTDALGCVVSSAVIEKYSTQRRGVSNSVHNLHTLSSLKHYQLNSCLRDISLGYRPKSFLNRRFKYHLHRLNRSTPASSHQAITDQFGRVQVWASFPDTTGAQASANPNGSNPSKPAQRIILATDKNRSARFSCHGVRYYLHSCLRPVDLDYCLFLSSKPASPAVLKRQARLSVGKQSSPGANAVRACNLRPGKEVLTTASPHPLHRGFC